jgi:hypothetical protein
MEPQWPNGEASDAHWRHMQLCHANDVLGGAEWEEKVQVRGYSPISSRPTVPACTVDEANMFTSFPQEPASTLAGQPIIKQSTAGGCTRPSTAATAQHYQLHHHTYESEEEKENEGREFSAPAGVAVSSSSNSLEASGSPWGR